MPITGKGASVPYEKSVKVVTQPIRLKGPAVGVAKGNGAPPKTKG
jgi:hypothetical protein